jgi:hypothetical protein
MQIRAGCEVFLRDLGRRRQPEGAFVLAEVPQAIGGRRFEPEQRPKCPPVHHARGCVRGYRKHQRVDVRPKGRPGVRKTACGWAFAMHLSRSDRPSGMAARERQHRRRPRSAKTSSFFVIAAKDRPNTCAPHAGSMTVQAGLLTCGSML